MIFKSLVILATLTSLNFAHAEEENFKPLYPPKLADHSKAQRLVKPELLEPKALSDVTGSNTDLKWNAVAEADCYHLQVATDPNFKWLVINDHSVKATHFALTGLESGKHYFWRVYGVKSDNEPQWTTGFPSWSSFFVK